MEEGGGHDVGTLRLRVVPYLDQAAMQQVSQQAQSAGAGGRGMGGFDPNGWKALDPGGWTAINARGGSGGGGIGPPVLFNPASPGGGGGGPYNSVIQNTVNNTYNRAPAQNQNQNRSRGINRAVVQGMFGAMDVGRATNAFLDAGLVTAERGSEKGYQAYMKAAEQAQGGLFGPIAGALVRGVEGWHQLLTGRDLPYGSMAAAERAGEDMRQGKLDADARGDRMMASAHFRSKMADVRDDRIQKRITNKYEKEMTAADQGADKVKRDYDIGLLQRQRAVADAEDAGEKHRAELELSRYSLTESSMIPEARKSAEVTKNEIKRKMGIDARALAREGRVFQAEAGGHFGEADERAFQNDLADRMDDARAAGGVFPMLQRGINAMAAGARLGKQRYQASGQRVRAAAFDALAGGREPDAMKLLADRSVDEARRNAPPGFEDDAAAEAESSNAYDLKKYWTARKDRAGALMDKQAISAFAADSKRSQFSAGRMAEVEAIYRGATRAAEADFREHRNLEARTILGTAENDLNAVKNDLFSSVTTFSGSINRVYTGGNSGDMSELLREISGKLDALKDIGKAN